MGADFDYVIVGAGVAGTYAAWRLAEAGVPGSSIALYEMFDQAGGRLRSVSLPGLGGVRRAELGAMAILPCQALLAALVEHLGLETTPFVPADRLYYLRGKRLRPEDLLSPERVPFQLEGGERGKHPGALVFEALCKILPSGGALDEEAWTRVKDELQIGGLPLHALSIRNLLQTVLSPEAYRYAVDAIGFMDFFSGWNAAEALPWIFSVFSTSPGAYALKDGYQALPVRLLERAMRLGVEFHPSHRLVRWEPTGSGEGDPLRLHLRAAGGDDKAVTAKNLILAMPRQALERIAMPENAELPTLLASVTPRPAVKLFFGYERVWWEGLGFRDGRVVTDLPLRQILFWGSNQDGFFDADVAATTLGVRNVKEHSLVMVSYADGADAEFLPPLLAKASSAPFGVVERLDPADPAVRYLIREVHSQLELIQGTGSIPAPYTAAYAVWAGDPFGGAWNTWNAGVKPVEVAKKMRKPYPCFNVFVCGEAYAVRQALVESALVTAERVLEEALCLPRPAWIPAQVGSDGSWS